MALNYNNNSWGSPHHEQEAKAGATIIQSLPQHEQFLDLKVNEGNLVLNKVLDDERWNGLQWKLKDPSTKLERVQIGERFFGLGLPGSAKPSQKQIEELLQQLLTRTNLRELSIRGTLHNSLSIAVFKTLPPQLQVLRLHSGITIDHTWNVHSLALAIEHHGTLKEISIRNFVIQCEDVKETRKAFADDDDADADADADAPVFLLDPLILAASSIETLECLDLSCIVAHRPKHQPFICPGALQRLLESCSNLRKLGLTKLGLLDEHLRVLTESLLVLDGSSSTSLMSEVAWNDNPFSESTFCECVLPVLQRNRTVQVLKVYNHSRLSSETCQELVQAVQANTCLHTLEVNLHWNQRASLEYYLALNAMGQEPRTPRQSIDLLASVKGNMSALFTVLQAHPEVCQHVEYSPPLPPTPPPMFVMRPPTPHQVRHVLMYLKTPWQQTMATIRTALVKSTSRRGVDEILLEEETMSSYSNWSTVEVQAPTIDLLVHHQRHEDNYHGPSPYSFQVENNDDDGNEPVEIQQETFSARKRTARSKKKVKRRHRRRSAVGVEDGDSSDSSAEQAPRERRKRRPGKCRRNSSSSSSRNSSRIKIDKDELERQLQSTTIR
jgi:hypothetical protein